MKPQESFGTILIVDDFAPLRRNLAFLLQIAGYDVITAENGAYALEALADERPDLVITDVTMPAMDGYALLNEIRARREWSHLPVILVSCSYALEDVTHALDMGASDYLPKPFDIYDVLDSIQRVAPHLIPVTDERIAG